MQTMTWGRRLASLALLTSLASVASGAEAAQPPGKLRTVRRQAWATANPDPNCSDLPPVFTVSLDEARSKVLAASGVDPTEIVAEETAVTIAGGVYQLELVNGDSYRVDGVTGRVATFFGSRVSNRTAEEIEADQLPQEQLEQIALQTAAQRYAEGAAMTLALAGAPEFNGSAYEYNIAQKIPSNGALTDNGCRVTVAADTGLVVFYSDRYTPIPEQAGLPPTITEANARDLSAAAAQMLEVTAVEYSKLLYTDGKLTWSLRIRGIMPSGEEIVRGTDVDATTGQILDVQKYATALGHRPPSGRVMLAGKILRNECAMRSKGQVLVSQKLVSALEGSVILKAGVLLVKGGVPVTVPVEQCSKAADGSWFLPAGILVQAFPTRLREAQIDGKRGSVHLISRAELADHATSQPSPKSQALMDGEKRLLGQLVRLGLLAPTPAAPTATPTAPSRAGVAESATGLWILGGIACGLSLWGVRRRRSRRPEVQ
ncbi:MAG: hypothetical protein K0Q72_5436 [Armatimonadetes bacterium]|nr:hypothetical protein [Armatimonadota bacterium]